MNLGLDGKVALITGGSHGIGLATALALAREGCRISILARDRQRLGAAKAQIDGYMLCDAIQADATNPEALRDAVLRTQKVWRRLHILINNVGGGGRWGTPLVETTEDSVWDEVYAKNAGAAVAATRAALPLMRQEKFGRVVTVTSLHGREAGGRPWFAMAKSAEIALMKSLSQQAYLVRDGLTFNTVAPGSVMIPDTGWAREAEENPYGFARFQESLPLGRLGTPEEVADLIAFLCSERARYINGACIAIDGGEGRAF